MTRYWMAMDEAIGLTLHALGLETDSHTMLDVGEPHLVRDIGERVARIVRPTGPGPRFVETGARPGERLFEELSSRNEELVRCGEAPIWRIARQGAAGPSLPVSEMLAEIRALLEGDDLGALRQRVMDYSQALQ
jgi:FlaA1/EpsC-like NDP-sugar epimerase